MKNEAAPVQRDLQLKHMDRESLYRTIFSRRDVRGQFLAGDIPADVLSRVLLAAHHAPSVGFMQPWNYILIRSREVREQVQSGFQTANEAAALLFKGKRGETYRSLKLEGILESPLNICVTCDRERSGPVVLGKTAQPNMDLYSTVCAVQNLWLAARAEGLGVGWVSIINEDTLSGILNLPENVVPVAYLCIGYVSDFFQKPELESKGWRKRMPLEDTIRFETWDSKAAPENESYLSAFRTVLPPVL